MEDKKYYQAHQAHEVNSKFKEYFGIPFSQFFQPFSYKNEIKIDLFEFDKYLIKTYEYDGSMSDCIKDKFGEEAHTFFEKLI